MKNRRPPTRRPLARRRPLRMNPRKGASGKVTIEDLAKLFKLPAYEELDDRNLDYYADQGEWAYKYALSQGKREAGAEKAREEAETEARDELFKNWHHGVLSAAEHLFEKHHLTLVPVGRKNKTPWEFRIEPTKSWREAAKEIVETINGAGMFGFRDVADFLRSGPYTPREGVLSHVHWIASYPEVYGDYGARHFYDRAFR